MKFIVGKKNGMTQIWQGDKVCAVTRIKALPCIVTQVKTEATDGYDAVQLGYGTRKEKNINKPQLGHMKGLGNFERLREFRDRVEGIKKGDKVLADTFEAGDKVSATGTSKGRGFQGVVKRHGFHGQDKTHGNKDQERMPGSIGSQAPQHVFKGTRMGGRMGGDRVTVKNLEIAKVDLENNEIYVIGAVPGANNGLILISGQGDLKFHSGEAVAEKAEEKVEEKAAAPVEAQTEDAPQENIEQVVIEASEKIEEKKD